MNEFKVNDIGNYKGIFLTFVALNEHGESVWQDTNTGFVVLNKTETRKVKLHVPEPNITELSLSPEELEVVTEAVTPDDPGVVVVFANNSTEILIQKTSKIVELNKELFDLRNKALDYELEICSNRNNYFVPLIPIFYPDCHVDFKTDLPGEVEVHGK